MQGGGKYEEEIIDYQTGFSRMKGDSSSITVSEEDTEGRCGLLAGVPCCLLVFYFIYIHGKRLSICPRCLLFIEVVVL